MHVYQKPRGDIGNIYLLDIYTFKERIKQKSTLYITHINLKFEDTKKLRNVNVIVI